MTTTSSYPSRSGIIALILTSLLLASHVVQGAAPAGPRDVTAKVLRVTGPASYTAGGAALPVEPGLELPAGSTVHTGRDATVVLDLGGSGRLSIKPDSSLTIDKLRVQKTGADTVVETELEVKKGSVLGNVRKLSAASQYNVKTARGVAGIRGTVFHVFAIGIFRCTSGALVVQVFDLNQNSVIMDFIVRPGQELNAAGNQPASIQPLAAAIARELRQEGVQVNRVAGGRDAVLLRVEGNEQQMREAIQRAIERVRQGQQDAGANIEGQRLESRAELARRAAIELVNRHANEGYNEQAAEIAGTAAYQAVLANASSGGVAMAASTAANVVRLLPNASDALVRFTVTAATTAYENAIRDGLTGRQAFAAAQAACQTVVSQQENFDAFNDAQRQALAAQAANVAQFVANHAPAGDAPTAAQALLNKEPVLSPTGPGSAQ
jgi:hypothetical protein